jgi:FkbM family methyltransferase
MLVPIPRWRDSLLVNRLIVRLLMLLPQRISIRIIRQLDIESLRWRFLRALLLRHRSRQLSRLMAVLKFNDVISISPTGEINVTSEGISLSAEKTNRYFKVNGRMTGNEGKDLAKVLADRNIHVRQFIDIGTNFGEISLYFSKNFPDAKVLSIEASPANFAIFQKNMARQHFTTDNISAVNKAVGETRGTVRISKGLSSGNTIVLDEKNALRDEVKQTEEIEMVPLGELAEQHGFLSPDFIKIDIEGSEPFLMNDLVKLSARAMFIEFANKNTEESYLRLARTLYDNGYSIATREAVDFEDFEQVRAHLLENWARDSWGTDSRGTDLWFFAPTPG